MKGYVHCFLLGTMFSLSCESLKPEDMVTSYYLKANEVVNGDSSQITFLNEHLSQAAKKQIQELPILLPYSLLVNTHGGHLQQVKIQHQQRVQMDSLIFQLELVYQDQSSQFIQQAVVWQAGAWRLGISK